MVLLTRPAAALQPTPVQLGNDPTLGQLQRSANTAQPATPTQKQKQKPPDRAHISRVHAGNKYY